METLIVGKTYNYNNHNNACELPATVLYIGRTHVFYRYENSIGFEYIATIKDFIKRYGNDQLTAHKGKE